MALLLPLLSILASSTFASELIRRLTSVSDSYCVWGETNTWIALKGDYTYGGTDSNDNDYWSISLLDGRGCYQTCGYKQIYIRKSTLDGKYQMAPDLAENCYITRCNDVVSLPEECTSWSTENVYSTNANNPLKILNGKCPDVHTETSLTSDEYCIGEFTKDSTRINIYRGNDIKTDQWGNEYQDFWFFNYPLNKWSCASSRIGDDFDMSTEEMTTKSCKGQNMESKLTFYN